MLLLIFFTVVGYFSQLMVVGKYIRKICHSLQQLFFITDHLIIVGKRDKRSAKCHFCKQEFEAETAAEYSICAYEDMRQHEIKLLSDALERGGWQSGP